ncbi:tyrosine-type recombinase/integrase, partial [Humibacter sp.]|uniref:tyrosine-type recombinase/integrase n=1 Tax=Humibacter sp. TaxID=1940291 RepID=UPI003F7FC407
MRRRRLSEGTIRLRLHYLHHFAETTDLATAQHDDLDAYVWSNPAWSSNTRAVVTATLKSFYRWAQRERLILVDPSRDLPAIDARRRRPRIATEEQILRAIRCDSLTDKAMIMLGAECGLRVNEIATLHRSARDG